MTLSARRSIKEKKPLNWRLILLFLVVLAVILILVGLGKEREEKVLILVPGEEKVSLASFDFKLKNLTVVEIPANTQVEAARGLGKWPLKSVWRLGESQKISGGKLLTETVRDNFFAPVFKWADSQGDSLLKKKPLPLFKFVVNGGQSNLSFSLRLKLVSFVLTLPSGRLNNIDLVKTGFLKETNLKNGERGFLPGSDLPLDLVFVFADPVLTGSNYFVSLADQSGSSVVNARLGKILESAGVKLGSIEVGAPADFDCLISSRQEKAAKELALIFDCQVTDYQEKLADKEILLKIGKKFKERF